MGIVHFSKEGCPLYYYRYEEAIYDEDGRLTRIEYCLGNIMSGRFFNNMIFAVYSDNPLDKDRGLKEGGSWGMWNERDGYCIVPNVSNYEEVVQTLLA